jgi:uncharacterized protein
MNPFIISSYKSPEFFCDREEESTYLIRNAQSGVNTVLVSLRRMGKTGLIRHVFHKLVEYEGYYLFYVDIDQTDTLGDFVNRLANGILKSSRKNLYEKFFNFLKQLRPVLTFSPITGMPEVTIREKDDQLDKANIEMIFNYLEDLDSPVVIALDEFQRILSYPEKRVEAFLRSHIQHLQNVRFIFSGSSRSMLLSMFGDHSRPFYQSAGYLFLERLGREVYADFVQGHFMRTGRSIDMTDIHSCLDWTDDHTFYSQYLFNSIWGQGMDKIDSGIVLEVQQEILASRDAMYSNYRRLLTEAQYQLLKAIALEKQVKHPNSSEFLQKYRLGSASTVNSAIRTLADKELVYEEKGMYKLYDVFQSQWFRMHEQ